MNPALRASAFLIATATASIAAAQTLNDSNLRLNTWTTGLRAPTGMEVFNSRGDIFAIEKNTGQVKIIRDRRVKSVALDLPVANNSERGLLGIVLSPSFASDNFVYTYHTAASSDGGTATGQEIRRYVYDGSRLSFSKTLRTLPADAGPNHNGGKMSFGRDGLLYVTTGDLNLNNAPANYSGTNVARSGAILRIKSSGGEVPSNPFYNRSTPGAAINDIYSYGVRNAFGLAHDPVSGNLWDTENGASSYDEINRITLGQNGGWERIMGPSSRVGAPQNLSSLGSAAAYSDPEFSWVTPIAPTDALFFPSGRLGGQYANDLLVGTTREGAILHFDLNSARDNLALSGGLSDGVADNDGNDRLGEQQALVLASGFGTISDLSVGPGGLFVTSYDKGIIYRITTAPSSASAMSLRSYEVSGALVPEPSSALALGATLCVLATCGRRSIAR